LLAQPGDVVVAGIYFGLERRYGILQALSIVGASLLCVVLVARAGAEAGQYYSRGDDRCEYMVRLAQLVRASDCGSEGRGFETHISPLRPLQNIDILKRSFFICISIDLFIYIYLISSLHVLAKNFVTLQ
jgi:hypothetical protein